MGDLILRLRNVLALTKLESTEGVDAAPTVTDAFPFEIDSLEIGSPFTTEDSNEATGTMIAGAPLVIGQPVNVRMRVRLKGAGAGVVYSASVKPPHHALMSSCGWRGVFQAAVAATALAAGTVTSGTLGAAYAATAQQYRGQRLILAVGNGAGAHPMITDYTAGKVATLADVFGAALNTTNTAEIKPNWTYAKTSPQTTGERTADEPSATHYIYEDGLLIKLFGFRGNMALSADTAKPGYADFTGTAIWGGQSDAAIPTGASVPSQAAPTLNMQAAISPAFAVNRKLLPISSFSYDTATQIDTYEDPNTTNGFGAAQLGGRAGLLTCDPLKTTLAVRNHLADLEGTLDNLVGVVRAGTVSGNRWALTLPKLAPASVEMGKRKNARSEALGFRALSPGRDSSGRDGDAILCFD
jgi:hypothetical protein